jgi:hypothetical protein
VAGHGAIDGHQWGVAIMGRKWREREEETTAFTQRNGRRGEVGASRGDGRSGRGCGESWRQGRLPGAQSGPAGRLQGVWSAWAVGSLTRSSAWAGRRVGGGVGWRGAVT